MSIYVLYLMGILKSINRFISSFSTHIQRTLVEVTPLPEQTPQVL